MDISTQKEKVRLFINSKNPPISLEDYQHLMSLLFHLENLKNRKDIYPLVCSSERIRRLVNIASKALEVFDIREYNLKYCGKREGLEHRIMLWYSCGPREKGVKKVVVNFKRLRNFLEKSPLKDLECLKEFYNFPNTVVQLRYTTEGEYICEEIETLPEFVKSVATIVRITDI